MKDGILNKYHFPILGFGTNKRNEREKLVNKLNGLQHGNNGNYQT